MAVEILLNTPLLRIVFEKGKIDEIKEIMSRGGESGMQSFDRALYNLFKQGVITSRTRLPSCGTLRIIFACWIAW